MNADSKDASQKVRRKSDFALAPLESTYGQIYVYKYINPNSNTLQPDRHQHDRPACVVAQQYLRLVALSFPQTRIRRALRKSYFAF